MKHVTAIMFAAVFVAVPMVCCCLFSHSEAAVNSYTSNATSNCVDHHTPSRDQTQNFASPEGHCGAISLGGMASVLKIRDDIDSYKCKDPCRYRQPYGTAVGRATVDEFRLDGMQL